MTPRSSPSGLQHTLRKSFFRGTLVSMGVLFMLLSVPPLLERMGQLRQQPPLEEVAGEAQGLISLLRDLPFQQQKVLLDALDTGQLQLLKRGSPWQLNPIQIGPWQLDPFLREEQVTLIAGNRVVWSQGVKTGPIPQHWKGHLHGKTAVVVQEDMGQLAPRLYGWAAHNLEASTWIAPLRQGQFLAITSFHLPPHLLGWMMLLLYGMVLMAWATLAFLPATLGSLWISHLFARREARQLSGPVERLSWVARELADGKLDTRLEPTGPAELQDLAADLNTIGEKLSRTLQDLQSTLQGQQTFLQGISHDLRTPLAHIQLFSEDLLDRLEGTALEHRARVIHRESLVLARLVDDVFDLLHCQQPGFRLHLQATGLHEVAQGVVEGFAERAHTLQVDLQFEQQGPAWAWVDPQRLQQALGHLIDNALEHTPAGGRVTVQVLDHPEHPEIRVQDTGSGIPEKDLPHIFERFYRASSSHQGPHAGLGLTLCKELVEKMHGHIAVESVPGAGCTFVVGFPRVPPVNEAPEQV